MDSNRTIGFQEFKDLKKDGLNDGRKVYEMTFESISLNRERCFDTPPHSYLVIAEEFCLVYIGKYIFKENKCFGSGQAQDEV